MAAIRYISKFEYAPGSFYTFPLYRYEYEPSQELVVASAALSGGNYSYDLLGSSRAPKRNSIHRLRFLEVGHPGLINADLDALRAYLYEGAQGKVWAKGTLFDDHDGEFEDERWAYGRIASMPNLQLRVENVGHVPAFVTFECSSDFYSEELEEQSFAITGTETVSVLNPGTAPVYNAVLTLKGTFSNPKIENLTNDYVVESERDGSSTDHWLQIRAPRRVHFSSNGGVTWTGDYANLVRNPVQLMVLEPGLNSLRVTGMSNGALDIEFYPAWH
jgi:hypothetical protein